MNGAASVGVAGPANRPAGRQSRRSLLALGSGVFLVHTLSPSIQPSDSRLSVLTAWSALTRGNFHLEAYRQVAGLRYRDDLVSQGGHLLPYFPWPTMLLATPAVLITRLFGVDPAAISISDPNRTFLLEVPTASALVALTTMLLYLAIRRAPAVHDSHRAAMLAALVFAFGSSAWSIASRALWQQTASMLFMTCSIVALQRLGERPRWAWSTGGCLVLCYLVRPTDAIFVCLALGYALFRLRGAIVQVLIPMVVLLSLFFAVSYTQYGDVLPPYFQVGRRFSEPKKLQFWDGILVNLVSPNRGLLIYDTAVVLAAAVGVVILYRSRRLRGLELVMLLAIGAQLVTISRYGSTGGPTYGPRLMIDILPFLSILGGPAYLKAVDGLPRARETRRTATIVTMCGAVLLWSVLVNATGATLRAGYCWSATPSLIDNAPHRVWSWSDPQFLRPYRDLANGDSLRQVAIGSCKKPITRT